MVQSWVNSNYIIILRNGKRKIKKNFQHHFHIVLCFKVLNISANGDIVKTSFVLGKS